MDDAELVRAARIGDLTAFTAIFDRHAARVHDLALAMLRDRGAALEVVESTFLEAGVRLPGLEEEYRLPVWILAITRRNGALRAGAIAGPDRQPSLPNDDPERVQLAGLVWEAVADLPLRDRTLLDLDLRQGLEGHDLADALGVTITQAQDLQARMRDRIEKGLSAYLVARTADGTCPDLATVLKGWDGRFTPKDSRRMADHVERCRICTQARFALPSPFALYAAALPAPFPAAVRPQVLGQVVLPTSDPGLVLVPVMAADQSPTEVYMNPGPVTTLVHESPTNLGAGAPVDPTPAPSPFQAPPPPPPGPPDPGTEASPQPADTTSESVHHPGPEAGSGAMSVPVGPDPEPPAIHPPLPPPLSPAEAPPPPPRSEEAP